MPSQLGTLAGRAPGAGAGDGWGRPEKPILYVRRHINLAVSLEFVGIVILCDKMRLSSPTNDRCKKTSEFSKFSLRVRVFGC